MSSTGNSGSSSSGGIGFCGLLAIVFIVLKLIGVIDWQWVWVLAPIWIPIAAVLVIVVFMLICHFLSKKKMIARRKLCRKAQ